MMLSTPQQRLKLFINERFAKQKDFADALGISTGDVPKYLKNDGSVFQTPEKIGKLTDLGLNTQWYFTGEGEMLLSDKENKKDERIVLNTGLIDSPTTKKNNFVYDILNIKLYNIPVHANRGALVQFDDLAYSYKPLYVGLKLDPNKCIGLNVVGDSMIDSQITNGSIIIVETGSQLNDGDRAVINHNGTLIVKYYRNCNTCELDECQDCKYKFKLYSRNHGEHEYPLSQDDEVVIIGKVKLVIQY